MNAQNIGAFSYLSNYSKLSSSSSQPLLKTDNSSKSNLLVYSLGLSFNSKKDYEFRVFVSTGNNFDSSSYKNGDSLIKITTISKDNSLLKELGICFLKHQKIGILTFSIGLFGTISKYTSNTYNYTYRSSRSNINNPFLYSSGNEMNIVGSPFKNYQFGLILGMNYSYKNMITLGFELQPNLQMTSIKGEQEYQYNDYGSNKKLLSQATIKQIDNATSYNLNLINPKLILKISVNLNKKQKPSETNKEDPYTK